MLQELGKASLLIFLAEMGDKTQLLAMAFALRYSVRQVLAGVALGSFCNHGLAVFLGAYLGQVIPVQALRLGAAFMFLGFGLWSLISANGRTHKECKAIEKPVLAIATAFFIGELGDKTQLTAVALASNAGFPGAILGGTVLGMLLTSLMGIFIGRKLGNHISGTALKLISSGVFIGFGFYGLAASVPPGFKISLPPAFFLLALTLLLLIFIVPPFYRRKTRRIVDRGQLAALQTALNGLCLGAHNCRGCRGDYCPLGYCKTLVAKQLAGEEPVLKAKSSIAPYLQRGQLFDERKLGRALALLRKCHLTPALASELESNLNKLIKMPRKPALVSKPHR